MLMDGKKMGYVFQSTRRARVDMWRLGMILWGVMGICIELCLQKRVSDFVIDTNTSQDPAHRAELSLTISHRSLAYEQIRNVCAFGFEVFTMKDKAG